MEARDSTSAWAATRPTPGLRTPTFRHKAVDGSSSVRRTVSSVELRAGDEIRIQGTPESGDRAAVDYIEILPYVK